MFFTKRFLCVSFTFFLLFVSFSLFLSLVFFSNQHQIHLSLSSIKQYRFTATHHNTLHESNPLNFRHVSPHLQFKPSDSILLPDWEVLLLFNSSVSSDSGTDSFYCNFQNSATSPAKFTGVLPFSNFTTYKCTLPLITRRLRPFLRPILTESSSVVSSEKDSDSPDEILRSEFLAYESLSTETDVILFVKGVNTRRNVNRSPAQLSCVFSNGANNNSVTTSVSSSSQEVFRCLHPNETSLRSLSFNGETKLKVSLQVEEEKHWTVPSVAYYTPVQRNVALKADKKLICACTMVYNVAKFLKEWVFYHSKIGVEKFVLYDNGSDDDLKHVLKFLQEENFDVEVIPWPWPKTQEAGFSHCALQAKESCRWMMYMDVDEFVFSPKWMNSSYPSHKMLRSLLPKSSSLLSSSEKTQFSSSESVRKPIGQVFIGCWDFGPSNQKTHPVKGVTQGYTCRKRVSERHKSIVLLDAVDLSLSNVIHHFRLKQGYRVKKLVKNEGIVNHYKYQAWSEFKLKFRRRVSTYVVDWTEKTNLTSKDRTPGLGFEAVKPEGWDNKFCEVDDNRLKKVTQKWFGVSYSNGYSKMAWQDDGMTVGSSRLAR